MSEEDIMEIGWLCKNCGIFVKGDSNNKPVSRYHLADMSEVYCSAKCSLDRHEKLKALNLMGDL